MYEHNTFLASPSGEQTCDVIGYTCSWLPPADISPTEHAFNINSLPLALRLSTHSIHQGSIL